MTPAAQLALAAILAYLFGSVPSAYLLVRLRKGVDLRHHGTGTVGISNAVQQAGGWVAVPLIVYDVFVKGWLPVFLASGVVLHLGLHMQIAIGVAAIAGHNWPIFLRFQGGRGVAPSLGVLLALHWPLLVAFGGVVTITWAATRNSPVAWFIGTLALPVLATAMRFLLTESAPLRNEVILFTVIYVFLFLLKRLLGSWPGTRQARPNGMSLARVVANRLILDRDTGSRDEWIKRKPGRPPAGPRRVDAR
ncbi:MAG: glycerol-3-phosphate acyltransferase [Chloroflexi bacterium]|nr:glycerol-3-phosphate acyltransferase [Chloroflexota bacterium]